MRVHNGALPYHCSFPGCTERFRWKSSVKPHMRLHLSENDHNRFSQSNSHSTLFDIIKNHENVSADNNHYRKDEPDSDLLPNKGSEPQSPRENTTLFSTEPYSSNFLSAGSQEDIIQKSSNEISAPSSRDDINSTQQIEAGEQKEASVASLLETRQEQGEIDFGLILNNPEVSDSLSTSDEAPEDLWNCEVQVPELFDDTFQIYGDSELN